jgi:hydrogenase small subunit
MPPESPPFCVVWIQGLTCNGNSHSFLNHPQFAVLHEEMTLLYHPLFPSICSFQEVLHREDVIDVLVIEGALSHDATVLSRQGLGMDAILKALLPRTKFVVCAGSCASFGGVFKERDVRKISGLVFRGEGKGGFFAEGFKTPWGHSPINLPGCPVHPAWIVDTLLLLKEKGKCALDAFLRPKEIYAYLVHHGCLRNEYFEWKVDCTQFGTKEGCLFYEQGCQGPMTHANCNKVLWNEVSSKTRVGSPCIGCTEPSFPKHTLYLTPKYMSLPAVPVGVPKRAYYALAGIAKGFRIDRLHVRLVDEEDE